MIEARLNKSGLNLGFVCGLMETIREISLNVIEAVGAWRE